MTARLRSEGNISNADVPMRVLSLFWHSIEPDSIPSEHLDGSNSTVSLFREQIRFIVEHFTPISIYDFMELTRSSHLFRSYSKQPVLLGFDDGFRNVLTQALPIVNEFRIPAVFFVTGEILKNPAFVPWFVEFKQLIRKARERVIHYGEVRIDLSLRQDYITLVHMFSASFRACKCESERQRLLTNLADSLGLGRIVGSELDADLQFATQQDLATLSASSLLTVASHAMTHRYLGSLTYEEQVEELAQSDSLLRKLCPSYYPVIAYPGGSFNTDTIAIAKRIYRAGFAVFSGSSYRNRYAHPRIGINYAPMQKFVYTVSPMRMNFLLPLKRLLHRVGIRR